MSTLHHTLGTLLFNKRAAFGISGHDAAEGAANFKRIAQSFFELLGRSPANEAEARLMLRELDRAGSTISANGMTAGAKPRWGLPESAADSFTHGDPNHVLGKDLDIRMLDEAMPDTWVSSRIRNQPLSEDSLPRRVRYGGFLSGKPSLLARLEDAEHRGLRRAPLPEYYGLDAHVPRSTAPWTERSGYGVDPGKLAPVNTGIQKFEELLPAKGAFSGGSDRVPGTIPHVSGGPDMFHASADASAPWAGWKVPAAVAGGTLATAAAGGYGLSRLGGPAAGTPAHAVQPEGGVGDISKHPSSGGMGAAGSLAALAVGGAGLYGLHSLLSDKKKDGVDRA